MQCQRSWCNDICSTVPLRKNKNSLHINCALRLQSNLPVTLSTSEWMFQSYHSIGNSGSCVSARLLPWHGCMQSKSNNVQNGWCEAATIPTETWSNCHRFLNEGVIQVRCMNNRYGLLLHTSFFQTCSLYPILALPRLHLPRYQLTTGVIRN